MLSAPLTTRPLEAGARVHAEVFKTDEAQLLSELAQYTGTTRYYRSSLGGLLLTDGAHYLRERLGCYWLIDIVESYQAQIGRVPFQLWSIEVQPDRSADVEMREDSGLEALVHQHVSYTDLSVFEEVETAE